MQKVRIAVIPAAGYGTRFLPFTKAIPKAMLPIINVPAIQQIVNEAVLSGIEEIYIVIGQHSEIIKAHFESAPHLESVLKKRELTSYLNAVLKVSGGAKVNYIFQEEQKGTGHAVLLAEKYIKNQPFAVMFGDDVMLSETPVLKQLISVYEKTQKTVIGARHVGFENVSKYASCEYQTENKGVFSLTAITEKPDKNLAKSDLAPLGRYVLRAGFFENLKKISKGINGEYQLTDALALEIEDNGLLAYEFKGERFDMGDTFGFLKANIEFALKNEQLSDKMKEYLKNLVQKF